MAIEAIFKGGYMEELNLNQEELSEETEEETKAGEPEAREEEEEKTTTCIKWNFYLSILYLKLYLN